jgi:hypothetical protein
MISRRGHGFADEVSGLLGRSVESVLRVVRFLSLAPCYLSVEPLPEAPVVLNRGDEQGVLPTPKVLRGDSTASPNGSVEVGSIIAVNDGHLAQPHPCENLR